MAKDNMLATNFVVELIAAALERKTVFEIVKQYLKFSYLQEEAEKKLWQWVTKRYDLTGKVPTIGQIQQQFVDDERVLELARMLSGSADLDSARRHAADLLSESTVGR